MGIECRNCGAQFRSDDPKGVMEHKCPEVPRDVLDAALAISWVVAGLCSLLAVIWGI
jgi:hypothetical protein